MIHTELSTRKSSLHLFAFLVFRKSLQNKSLYFVMVMKVITFPDFDRVKPRLILGFLGSPGVQNKIRFVFFCFWVECRCWRGAGASLTSPAHHRLGSCLGRLNIAIKLAKVRCAPHRSQNGHRSAGGANVLKFVARGARPKLLKFGGPRMSRTPR